MTFARSTLRALQHALLHLGATIAVAWGPSGCHRNAASPDAATEYERLADRVVASSARVGERDQVLVTGSVDDMPLMEALALSIRRRGAFPLLSPTSDRLERRLVDEIPAGYAEQVPALELAMAGSLTAVIYLTPETEEAYRGLDPHRLAAVARARQPVDELQLRRRVRQVSIGNEVYPSMDRAKRLGVPMAALRDSFFGGLDVDAHQLRAAAAPIRKALAEGHQLTIAHSNGTSLGMRIDHRPVIVNDGELSPDCWEGNGAACLLWLPAGEVYLTPVPGTAEGRIVVERVLVQETKVEGLVLTFHEGALTEISATSGVEAVRALYDSAGPGKERLSMVDIGLNPNVRHVPGSCLLPPVAAGMVSIGIGRDIWVGGDNDTNFGMQLAAPGSTVLVDGVAVVSEGKLQR